MAFYHVVLCIAYASALAESNSCDTSADPTAERALPDAASLLQTGLRANDAYDNSADILLRQALQEVAKLRQEKREEVEKLHQENTGLKQEIERLKLECKGVLDVKFSENSRSSGSQIELSTDPSDSAESGPTDDESFELDGAESPALEGSQGVLSNLSAQLSKPVFVQKRIQRDRYGSKCLFSGHQHNFFRGRSLKYPDMGMGSKANIVSIHGLSSYVAAAIAGCYIKLYEGENQQGRAWTLSSGFSGETGFVTHDDDLNKFENWDNFDLPNDGLKSIECLCTPEAIQKYGYTQ